MNLRLLRQDPAWRALPATCGIALLVGLLLRTVGSSQGDVPFPLGHAAPVELGPGFAIVVGLLTLHGWFALFPANFATRCSRLNLVLPLSARRLWVVRIVSLIAAGMLPMLVFALVMAFGGPGLDFHTDYLRLGLKAAFTIALAAVLLQSPSLRVHRNRATPEYVIAVGFIGLGVTVLVVATSQSLVGILLPAVLALGVGVALYRRLPAGFGLAVEESAEEPAEPEPVPAAEAPAASWPAPPRVSRWLLHRTIGRTLHVSFLSVTLMFLLAVYGLLVADGYHTEKLTVHWVLFLAAMMMNYVGLGMRRLHRLQSFPIARRILFAHLMLPAIVVVILGAGLFELFLVLQPRLGTQVQYFGHELRVPKDCWDLASGDEPPHLTAPWGESHPLTVRHAWGEHGPAVVDPFEIPEGASTRFVAWQVERAVRRVHGGEVPITVPEPDEEYRAAIERGSFTVEASVGRGSEGRSRTYLVYLVACGAVVLLLMTLAFGQHGGVTRPWIYQGMLLVVILGIFAVILVLVVLGEVGMTDPDAAAAWLMVHLRHLAETIPLGLGALRLASLGLFALGYLFLQRRFEGMEFSRQMEKKQWAQEY